MVSAVCPVCHILLVEATDPSIDNLAAAVDEAVALGAQYVSNSYGAPEDPSETDYDSHYDHPGVVVTASSADAGCGVWVGRHRRARASRPWAGRGLVRDSSARGWARETVRNGAGWAARGSRPSPSGRPIRAARSRQRRPRGERWGSRTPGWPFPTPSGRRLAGVRRHQRRRADHRLHLRPGGHPAHRRWDSHTDTPTTLRWSTRRA